MAMHHDNHIPHFIASLKLPHCLKAALHGPMVLQPGCWEVLKLDHPHHTTTSPHGKAKHVMDICDQVTILLPAARHPCLHHAPMTMGRMQIKFHQFPGLLTRASFGLKPPVYATSVWL